MKYGVIDITSTSVSLKIYKADSQECEFSSRSALSAQSFIEKGRLTERGILKLIAVLRRMQEECSKYGASGIYAISSSVARNLNNVYEVSEKIKAATGITVNSLDAEGEAYCDCVSNRTCFGSECVLIDVSGASVVIADMGKDERGLCLPFGALTLQRKFVAGVFPTQSECDDIKKYVKKKLKAFVPECKKETLVLTGNVSRSLYALYSDVYSVSSDEPMEYEKLKKLLKKLIESENRSALVMKNAPEKIYFITSALAAVVQIIKYFSPEKIVMSDRGVKEGYLTLCLNGEIAGVLSPVAIEREKENISSVEELTERIKKRGKRPASSVKKKSVAKGKATAKEKLSEKEKTPTSAKKKKESVSGAKDE